MNLGKSLKIAIATKEIKTKDLADGLLVSRQQVSNWKRTGSISSSRLVDICKYFDMEVSEFIALGEG